jgi:hypothetical protein
MREMSTVCALPDLKATKAATMMMIVIFSNAAIDAGVPRFLLSRQR